MSKVTVGNSFSTSSTITPDNFIKIDGLKEEVIVDMSQEIWRTAIDPSIPSRTCAPWDFSMYEVSNYGRCRRKLPDGKYRYIKGSLAGPKITNGKYQYIQVQLTTKCGPVTKRISVPLGRLILISFIGKPLPKGWIVRVKDGDKRNLRISNLKVMNKVHDWVSNDWTQVNPKNRSAHLSEIFLNWPVTIHDKNNIIVATHPSTYVYMKVRGLLPKDFYIDDNNNVHPYSFLKYVCERCLRQGKTYKIPFTITFINHERNEV